MSINEELNAKAYIQGLKDGKEIGRAEDIHKFISWLHETHKIDIHIWETLDDYACEYLKENKE